ncbi:MAG: hypothetical protein AB1938_27480 [Myxococcota bacterium]
MSITGSLKSFGQNAVNAARQKVQETVAEVRQGVGQAAAAVTSKAEGVVDGAKRVAESSFETAKATAAAAKAAVTGHASGGGVVGELRKGAGREGTMSLGELQRGYETLKAAFKSPNTQRTASAEAELLKLKLSDVRNMGELTPDIEQALLRGVAIRRSDSDRGQEGFLGPAQVRDAGEAVMKMSRRDHDELTQLLAKAGKKADGTPIPGADADAERALILKAVAARKKAFTGDDIDAAASAMKDIHTFADDIRGQKRDELIRTTTAIDLDGASNAEGLKQKFENTCGPTTAQLIRAEADPIFARRLHQNGLTDKDITSAIGQEQEWTMRVGSTERHVAVARADLARRDEVLQLIDKSFTKEDAAILKAALSEKGYTPRTPDEKTYFRNLLLDLQEVAPDMTPEKVERFRQLDPSLGGMYLEPAMGLTVGSGYRSNELDGTSFQDIRRALKEGRDVPVRFEHLDSEGKFNGSGHFMALTDYRDGKYLVSDPYSGRTAWLTEDELRLGTVSKHFPELTSGRAAMTHWYSPE